MNLSTHTLMIPIVVTIHGVPACHPIQKLTAITEGLIAAVVGVKMLRREKDEVIISMPADLLADSHPRRQFVRIIVENIHVGEDHSQAVLDLLESKLIAAVKKLFNNPRRTSCKILLLQDGHKVRVSEGRK